MWHSKQCLPLPEVLIYMKRKDIWIGHVTQLINMAYMDIYLESCEEISHLHALEVLIVEEWWKAI